PDHVHQNSGQPWPTRAVQGDTDGLAQDRAGLSLGFRPRQLLCESSDNEIPNHSQYKVGVVVGGPRHRDGENLVPILVLTPTDESH
ncbi:hypothetical protein, partial [Amycolatopsis decaplanina]|uniref:hypothetical protein n=1 Tax=Amycolatopsis decaplanina TaxID=208441 RepID=UPI001F2847AD